MVKFKYFFAFMFLCGCCKYPDPEIGLKRENYNGDELRLDGYYIQVSSNFQGPLYVIYFLYKNGIILNGGSKNDFDVLDDYAISLTSQESEEVLRKVATGWGVFTVNNKNIVIEIPLQGKKAPVKTYIFNGKIIDNSSFLITNEFSNYTGKNRIVNDTFYFRPLSVKPDSTNRYIK